MRTEKEFREDLKDGQAFEDFCHDVLWSHGIAVGIYKSRAKQWTVGESRLGAEIKFDNKQDKYGNVFIETRERRTTDGASRWRDAGIYDDSKPWLYVVGNFHRIFIFGVRTLQRMHKSGQFLEKKTETSEGFVVPLERARDTAEKYLEGETLSSLLPWHRTGEQR